MKNDLRLFVMRVVLAALICNLILTLWKLIEVKLPERQDQIADQRRQNYTHNKQS